jgi:hypothetical protein
MRRAAKLAVGLAVAAVVLGLFLMPAVPISIEPDCASPTGTCSGGPGVPASTSVTYAYLGAGAVRVPNFSPLLIGPTSYSYCLVYGNPGMMCGQSVQRINW